MLMLACPFCPVLQTEYGTHCLSRGMGVPVRCEKHNDLIHVRLIGWQLVVACFP